VALAVYLANISRN